MTGDKTAEDEDVFTGGFHGNCEGDEPWRYIDTLGQWGCTYFDGTRTEIDVTFYNIRGTDNLEGEHAGFEIGWEEMSNWDIAYPFAPAQGDIDGGSAEPVEVRSQCWAGERSERPEDLSEVVNVTNMVEEGETTYVIGELPERSGSFTPDVYSCVFGFQQSILNTDDIPFEAIDVFNQGETCDEDAFACVITEGSQDAGSILVDLNHRHPGGVDDEGLVHDLDWLEERSASTDSSEQAEDANTGELFTDSEPWPHHPRKDQLELEPRHPVDVWEDEYVVGE